MARSRNIKPGFFLNDTLCAMPPLARLLFAGLWTVCDRDGRAIDRPQRIKAEVLPYDDCNPDELLAMLHAGGFIDRYKVDGIGVIQVCAWDKHQNPHVKEQASTLPCKPKHQTCTGHAQGMNGGSTGVAVLIPSSLIPDSLSSDSLSSDSEVAPSALSGKPARKRASKPTSAPTNDCWTAYAQAYRERYGVDPVRNGKVNGQLAQLVGRLGADEAPGVARSYLDNRNGLYVAAKHCVDLLLRDCEKLRTEWVTGQVTHQKDAREVDRIASKAGMAERVIAHLEAKGIK